MTEMVHGMVGAVPREPVLPRWWRSIDRWSLGCVLMLLGIGLLLGLAASPPLAARHNLPPFHYVERQALFGVVGILVILGLSMCDPRALRRLGVIGCLAAIAAILLLPFLGTDFGKGAVRWFSLGFASLQPSEFLKPCLVVLSAWLMAAATEIGGLPGRLWSFLLTGFVALLLALQPDFGQAVLVLFGWGVMYFVGGAPIVLLLVMFGGTVFAGTLAYRHSEHFARRIDGFLAAEIDPRTQIGFATDAIREGGFFGVGVGEGRVKWSLPDAQTDFIIAVAAEEYGLVLVLFIIVLFLIITLRSIARLMRERDPFIRLAGAGLVALFAMQAVINMGVAVRMLPAKGMTLPFVSNGGSSLVAAGITLGMLLAFTRARPQGEIRDILRARR